MQKIIIAGFAGIGKTTLGKKYKNVIDLDAAEYVYDDRDLQHLSIEQRKGMNRKPNPDWPDNYINAIKEALNIYDIILVWDRPDVLNEYEKNYFDYWIIYPDKEAVKSYNVRYLNRGNSQEYVKKKMRQYKEYCTVFEQKNVKKILLSKEETLEDYLLTREDIKLIKM